MALVACANCGWMCNESDVLCNMCGRPIRPGAPPRPTQPNPFMALPPPGIGNVSLTSTVPGPDMGALIQPLKMCTDCGNTIAITAATCPCCGYAPGGESPRTRRFAEWLDRTMKLRRSVTARAVTTTAGPHAFSESDPGRLDALRACLQLDCSAIVTKWCERITVVLEVHGVEGTTSFGLDGRRGVLRINDKDGWCLPLRDPGRAFRWLSERGMTGLSAFA